MQTHATRLSVASSPFRRLPRYVRSTAAAPVSLNTVQLISSPIHLEASCFQSCNVSTRLPTTLHQVREPDAKGRVFIFRSGVTDPYINLSLEHYLLQNAHPESRILFLYVNRPCVVIGRNQNPWVECAMRKLALESLSLESAGQPAGNSMPIRLRDGNSDVLLVRRRSGGGAVFHDEGNLNYSVIVPNHAKVEFKRKTHAEMVVRAVRGVQWDLALSSAPVGDPRATPGTGPWPPSAILEKINVRVNERNDIVMDDPQRGTLKVSGSAFRLIRGRALHHGTLLFASPHLKSIGEFLTSPARNFIRAKGVESVRSPVGNLFGQVDNAQHRERLRRSLEIGIAAEFRKMYGEEVNARVRPSKDASTLVSRELPEDISSEANESTDAGTQILKGVREITSAEWKFEQTPEFVVSAKPVDSEKGFSPPIRLAGLLEAARIFMRVKHGIIQDAELSLPHGEGALAQEERETRSRLQGRKLHEISDWNAVFEGLHAWGDSRSGRLAGWLSHLFPPLFPNPRQRSGPGPVGEHIEQEAQSGSFLQRQHADGVVEIEEQGERLVRELR